VKSNSLTLSRAGRQDKNIRVGTSAWTFVQNFKRAMTCATYGAAIAVRVREGRQRKLEQDAFEITAFKILMHLYENNSAADPISHVVRYWVQRRDEEFVASKVSEVLEHLVAKGVIKRVGRKPVYKLNPAKEEEILTLLDLIKPLAG
jgi:hypothetical protein